MACSHMYVFLTKPAYPILHLSQSDSIRRINRNVIKLGAECSGGGSEGPCGRSDSAPATQWRPGIVMCVSLSILLNILLTLIQINLKYVLS